MAKIQYLKNPPITEALIDIRIQSPAGDFPSCIQDLSKKLVGDYPSIENSRQSSFKFFAPTDGEVAKSEVEDFGINGVIFKNSDESRVVQMMNNRFTFSQLAPYSNWETLQEEAEKLWYLYVNAMKPEIVTRIATRYINKIFLPYPLTNFKEYLESPPEIPEHLPKGLASYITKISILDEKNRAMIIINQVFSGVEGKKCPVILDIDTFKAQPFDDPNDPEIWNQLRVLRELKNETFFRSITDKTVELYK